MEYHIHPTPVAERLVTDTERRRRLVQWAEESSRMLSREWFTPPDMIDAVRAEFGVAILPGLSDRMTAAIILARLKKEPA
jgi:hypothetical protein